MGRVVTAACCYASLWWLLSGYFEFVQLVFGGVAVIAALVIAHRLDIFDEEAFSPGIYFRTLAFLPWLIKEVIAANLMVSQMVLAAVQKLSPRIVRVQARQDSELGKVIHANAITITPGTVSLDVRGNTILVHALDAKTAASEEDNILNEKVNWLEGDIEHD